MTERKIDNGNETVVANETATDNRAIANGKALAIAEAVMKSETAIALTAKEHGVAIFRSVHRDSVSLDTLIGESKLAAGWKTLANSDAGRKAKNRLNVYFSNYRLVAENWETLSVETRDNILNGETSPHYVADTIRKAEREAAAAARKAEAEAAKEAEGEAEALTLTQKAEAFLADYLAADMEARNAAFDAIAAIMAAVDDDTAAQGMTEAEQTAAAA